MEKREKHFVLVHGGCHGAWCWYKVVTLLQSAGHKVSALDMAASGVHPKHVHEVHSLSDYWEPLMAFMDSLPPEERVILVGHSMGGVGISIAMEKFHDKVSVAVFASALSPSPNLSYHLHYMILITSFDLHQDLMLALLLLGRSLPLYIDEATTAVIKEKYGSVRRVFVVCDQDNVIKEDLQRWMLQKNSVDEITELSGSDHMLRFSKAQELSSCLQLIAQSYS
ncbi:LOW QUALITY PROTEIN: Abhydrolase_6 domain-containing protein [Cephalotus follicularis]|uniref:Abhydrolase_6 domain-containing protein n=1 Tax=Cephalotus follicularis TaxID=3775 RepID=A0A1Q3D3C2_CEPFO|nr:LOW QUALITY PROTEIN: Abhydrolase_6 domain-containing protein [Cephalotus follicularis]